MTTQPKTLMEPVSGYAWLNQYGHAMCASVDDDDLHPNPDNGESIIPVTITDARWLPVDEYMPSKNHLAVIAYFEEEKVVNGEAFKQSYSCVVGAEYAAKHGKRRGITHVKPIPTPEAPEV